MGLLVFGVYLVYKLRNASSEVYKEKLVLSVSLFIELFISLLAYTIRHSLWRQLSWQQLLILYCLRSQLTVSVTLILVFAPKVSWVERRPIGTKLSRRRMCVVRSANLLDKQHTEKTVEKTLFFPSLFFPPFLTAFPPLTHSPHT